MNALHIAQCIGPGETLHMMGVEGLTAGRPQVSLLCARPFRFSVCVVQSFLRPNVFLSISPIYLAVSK